MPRKDITASLLRKLYYKNQLSKKEIAHQLICNITTIHKKMIKYKIQPRTQQEATKIAMTKQTIKIQKSLLKSLYLTKKLTISETAKVLKFDPQTIRKELIRHNIPLYTKAESIHLAKERNKIPKIIIKNLYYNSHLTQDQISQKLGKSRAHIHLLMKEYGLLVRKSSITQLRYPKFDFSKNLVEKAYLIGFRQGDLHVKLSPSGNFIRVDCTSTKEEQIELFKNLFQKYGFVWVGKPRPDGNKLFAVSLNHTFNFLLPKQDKIPEWVMKKKKYFLSFMAGYTDAEGCIGVFSKLARFTIASYDKNILKQTYEKLTLLGIPCNPPRILVKKLHITSGGHTYRNNHWYFTIVKKSSLLLLLHALKPYLKHKKRVNDLQKARENIIWRNQKLSFSKIFLQKFPSV